MATTRRWLSLSLAVVTCALILVGLTACARRPATRTIMVRGGPSLGPAFEDLAQAFTAANPGTRVETNFTCPPCILPQTEGEKAHIDVFVTPGDQDIERLHAGGQLDLGYVTDCGSTRVCLVASKQAAGVINGLEDLKRPDIRRIGIGDPAQVAVGTFAKQALERAKLWDALQPKLFLTQSGCELLKLLGLGRTVDAAFTFDYCELEPGAGISRVLTLPDDLAPVVPVRIGTSRDTTEPELARQFVDFVNAPAGQAVLRRHNIGAPPPTAVTSAHP